MGRPRVYRNQAERAHAYRRRHGQASQRPDEWETPLSVFQPLHAEFGFDVDLAATPDNTKCDRFIPPGQDSLTQPWRGSCWLNPPFSKLEPWLRKAVASSEMATIVVLLPLRPGTRWWQTWVAPYAAEVRVV